MVLWPEILLYGSVLRRYCGTLIRKEIYQIMWENFLISLEIMGKGMLGIFVVIGLLTLAVSAMGKLSHKEENAEKGKN